MKFGEALSQLQLKETLFMRRSVWDESTMIGIETSDKLHTIPYLYVSSRYGRAPWIPNMVEMCSNSDWVVFEKED